MPRNKDFDEQEVLEKAMYLFWKEGYKTTSIDKLCDKLGISRSSLYVTYGNKKKLFLKALKHYKSKSSEVLKEFFDQDLSVKTLIQNFFEMVIDEIPTDQERKGCFIVNTTTEMAAKDEDITEFIINNQHDLEEIFENLILFGQQSGEISSDKDAKQLAVFYFTLFNGIRVVGKITTDYQTFKSIIPIAISVL